MECPFVEVGCSAVNISTLSSYQKHLSDNIELHLEMVLNLHRQNLGGDLSLPNVNPGKLNAINQEVEYLDGVLQQYEMNLIPSLKCIKSVLALPDIYLRKMGDNCSFRMPGYSLKRSSKSKWLSPSFLIYDGYQVRLCVHANGINSGASTHISVALLLCSDTQIAISLSPNVGIRVELLHDDPDFETDKQGSDMKVQLTWMPNNSGAVEKSMRKLSPTSTPKLGATKRISGLPPWCSPPPNGDESTESHSSKSEGEGIVLVMSEKFAPLSVTQLYAQTYNSLVFQVSLCRY
jgi:hypothetical protein